MTASSSPRTIQAPTSSTMGMISGRATTCLRSRAPEDSVLVISAREGREDADHPALARGLGRVAMAALDRQRHAGAAIDMRHWVSAMYLSAVEAS